jgi:hypothetical protein
MVALCGGTACPPEYQETPESVLMLGALLEELVFADKHLATHQIILDHGSLNSAQNVVNLLYLIGSMQTLHCDRRANFGCVYYEQTMHAFQKGSPRTIRKLVAPGVEMVDEIVFVTYRQHFDRLAHIIRVGLGISERRLKLSHLDTGEPTEGILDAEARSMSAALEDPLSISPAAMERLQERLVRMKALSDRECPVSIAKHIHRTYMENLDHGRAHEAVI